MFIDNPRRSSLFLGSSPFYWNHVWHVRDASNHIILLLWHTQMIENDAWWGNLPVVNIFGWRTPWNMSNLGKVMGGISISWWPSLLWNTLLFTWVYLWCSWNGSIDGTLLNRYKNGGNLQKDPTGSLSYFFFYMYFLVSYSRSHCLKLWNVLEITILLNYYFFISNLICVQMVLFNESFSKMHKKTKKTIDLHNTELHVLLVLWDCGEKSEWMKCLTWNSFPDCE